MSMHLLVKEQKDKSYIVIEIMKNNFEVCYIVRDYANYLICECNGYERDGIPCRHEYAVSRCYGLTHKLREIAAFNLSEIIHNALGQSYNCPNIGNLEESDIELPNKCKQPGRPKTLRYRDPQEYLISSRQKICSICGKHGHNKRTCKELNSITNNNINSDIEIIEDIENKEIYIPESNDNNNNDKTINNKPKKTSNIIQKQQWLQEEDNAHYHQVVHLLEHIEGNKYSST